MNKLYQQCIYSPNEGPEKFIKLLQTQIKNTLQIKKIAVETTVSLWAENTM